MNKPIKSYKAFDENMRCRGFQYEVGKEYDMNGDIQCCKRGFHACESPMEVWDYYDMLTSRFAEVEQSGKISTEADSTKICSSHITIKAELKLADIINIGVEWLKDLTAPSKVKADDAELNDNGVRGAQIGSSGDSAKIGSSGYSAKIGSSGYSAKIGSSGYSAKIGSSGDYAKIGSSGDYAKIGSSGDYAKIGSSGYSAKIGSSGYSAKIGSSGYSAKIGSSGDSAKIGSSGDYAKIGSSGDYAKIGSSGDYAKIGSSGDSAKIGSSGYSAKIDSTGENSVIMCAGRDSVAKAKVGSWITLAEWEWDDEKECRVPVCVKTERVDGIKIKPDTWYRLRGGEFVEVTK
jgi:hypothetical protein